MLDDTLAGEEALVATANLLYQRMRSDNRLEVYFTHVDIPELASCLRRFLTNAFQGAEWPNVQINDDLVVVTYDGFVDVLLESVAKPLPLGAHVLTTGINTLCDQMMQDERIVQFMENIHEMSFDDEAFAGSPSDRSSANPVEEKPGSVEMDVADGDPVLALSGDGLLAASTEAMLSKLGATADMDQEIVVTSFSELTMPQDLILEVQRVWRSFIHTSQSMEAGGEAIFNAFFDSAPQLQVLFTSPRAVHALRFMNEMNHIVMSLDNPPKLKVLVETLGFSHLHWEISIPRVIIFRDAVLDTFAVELGESFTMMEAEGWKQLLNYIGGAIVFIKAHYAERINILLDSWTTANDKLSNSKTEEKGSGSLSKEVQVVAKKNRWKVTTTPSTATAGGEEGHTDSSRSSGTVPTTYPEMFKFNAAVMGFGDRKWLEEVLACFHNIVVNVSHSGRLQEECDVLALRISKCTSATVNFAEYKSCMLASLRSLLPKDWSTNHEVAWSWLWENVERVLQKTMGSPPKWEASLSKFFASLDDTQKYDLRGRMYARFFQVAAAGQDYFKQSNTYLHFIAERVMGMTVEIYRDPVKLVDDISALGLRHVGYGIPTELFGPLVSCYVDVVREFTTEEVCVDSFRWSLVLISKILVRTIVEGSTIVMKAVNANNARQLQRAIGTAARGERCTWMLLVQVGTQSISPLSWSLQSGKLEAASAMLVDLLTIRADRDRYYYGADELFARHADVVMRLRDEAPTLLPVLLDGLVWRSRVVESGQRRVNYYIKHLLINTSGGFANTLQWIVESKDPRLVCHPVMALLSDIVWKNVTSSRFLVSKMWLIVTLCIFVSSQAILEHLHDGEGGRAANDIVERVAIFCCRVFIYLFSMTQIIFTHTFKLMNNFLDKDFVTVYGFPFVPRQFLEWQELASFVLGLTLVGMLCTEPIVHCLNTGIANNTLFTEVCGASKNITFLYTLLGMAAMFLYYSLLFNLVVFSNRISAYALVCGGMLSELGLFLSAFFVAILTFSSCVSVLRHEFDFDSFTNIPHSMVALMEISLGMYTSEKHEALKTGPLVFIVLGVFMICVIVFLVNLLVAQLTCAYDGIFVDMLGSARLTRIRVIVEFMPKVPASTWEKFVRYLQLEKPLEFNQGDVGLPGGIQVLEAANLNPTTVEQIRRFGGSTSVTNQWPEEENLDEDDRFDRMEKLIQQAAQMVKRGRGGSHQGSTLLSGTQQSRSQSSMSKSEVDSDA